MSAFMLAGVLAKAADVSPAFSVEDWGPRSGLPAGSVRAITQAPDGYLWLLTSQGPHKFDGVRFTPPAELSAALGDRVLKVRAMTRGADGALWFGGPDFVLRLAEGRTQLFERPLNVARLVACHDGSVWIAHEDVGLTRLRQGRFESQPSPPVIFSALHEDSKGVLWAGGWGAGLFRVEDGRLLAAGRHGGGYVNDLGSDASGTLWVATRAGLHALDGERAVPLLAGANVTATGAAAEGGQWIGTRDGAVYHVHGGGAPRLEPVARAPNQVLALFEDREGSVWIGHPDGLRRAKPGPFLSYGEQPWLARNPAMSILETEDGAIWVFSDGGGLSRIKDGDVTRLTSRDGLASDYGGPLLESRDGTLWVGTAKGLTRIRNGTVTSYTTGLLSGAVSALFEDEEGLVVAPEFAGLHRFRDGRLVPYRVAGDERFQGWYIYQAHRARDGTVWLAANNGLVAIRHGEARIFSAANGLLEDNVRGLHEDEEGTLWIATAKVGLARFAGGRLLTITKRQGLEDDRVYAALAANDGHVWMSSPRGLFRVSRDDVEALAAGRAERVPSMAYDVADGLLTTDFAAGAQPPAWKSRDGRLWFGTQKGVVAVDTTRVRPNRLPPPVVIEGVTLDGRDVPAKEPVVVAPGVRRVEFHFTGLSLLVPQRVRFRYRLEGADMDWLEDHRHSASYMNLRPGRYTFRVTASNNDGVWNETGAVLALDVQPFFYQTAFFRWLLVAAVLGAVYAAHRRRVAGVHRRYEAVIEERTRIAREMHDTLAQNLGGLALLLDSIKAQHRHLSGALGQQLEEASRLLRYDLAEAYRAIRDLRAPDLDGRDLKDAAGAILERATKGSGAQFRVEGPADGPPLPPRVRDELLRILQEAAANAARHARAGTIEVELRRTDGRLQMTVSDDGEGFDAAHAFVLEAGHYGLIGMRERAKRIGGRLEIESAAGKGTRLSVEVPAR